MKPYWWWTQEQKDFYEEVGEFMKSVAKEEAKARYTREWPYKIFEEIGKRGYIGAAVPKEYGGLGLGCTGSVMLAEQMFKYAPGIGYMTVGNMNGGLRQILENGTEEQKAKFLPKIASGEAGAVAITEVTAGTDTMGIALTAEKKDGGYVLNGRKRFIVGAGVAKNYFIYAVTSNDPEVVKKRKHLSAFMVNRDEVEGIVTERINEILGFEYLQNGSLIFDHVEIPEFCRIGAEGDGFKIMMQGLNYERTNISGQTVGMMRMLLNYVVPYGERRIQFGKPTLDISQNQDKIAHMIARLKLMRDATYVTAKQWDLEENITVDASVIKGYGVQYLLESANEATQIMGGDGVNTFYPIKNIFEIAKTNHIAGGTIEACDLTIFRQQIKGYPEDFVWPRRVIDKEVGLPVVDYSPVEAKVACTAENMLNILAEDYKVNQGLHMTIADLQDYIDGSDDEIRTVMKELVASGYAIVHTNRKNGEPVMARASYEGLSKAHPNEYYQWLPLHVAKDKNRF